MRSVQKTQERCFKDLREWRPQLKIKRTATEAPPVPRPDPDGGEKAPTTTDQENNSEKGPETIDSATTAPAAASTKFETFKDYFTEKRPAQMAERMNDLIEDAETAYKFLIHILDLKQQQAALLVAQQARVTNTKTQEILASSQATTGQLLQISTKTDTTITSLRELSTESKRGGNIVLIFTVITIIFLPLSTIASLFSVNAFELNDGKLPISTVFAIICEWRHIPTFKAQLLRAPI
ncbi:hypothetical protein TWF481_001230 [Arthrobotrys musiformis]|uniref:t-SNARE coiled-coil homology domain-containing protein n=1 Tax=Arthrobotrys musiformis TaxID=47236 RepID=A0AAV9WR19_9PEZI